MEETSSKVANDHAPDAKVTKIFTQGLWLLVHEEEHFLPFGDFPWFKEAKVSAILNVWLLNSHHLHWPDLDVDLELDSIRNPQKYPLVAR